MRIHTLILLLFAASAVADDVILRDGTVLSGKVVDEGKRYTVVDRDRKFAVSKAEVARLVSKPSFMDEYEARLKKLPFDDAEAIFEFGPGRRSSTGARASSSSRGAGTRSTTSSSSRKRSRTTRSCGRPSSTAAGRTSRSTGW
ncbi:MAG: hypothetical protein ACYTGI_17925 [Planctomycetota bacterium]|jgi:hypothetical protein